MTDKMEHTSDTPFRLFFRPLASPAREAEREAALSLIREAFGPDATYSHAPDGAPVLLPEREGVCISLSHSRDMCALATASQPVGVDIEQPRPQLVRVMDKFLSEREKQLLGPEATPQALLPYWTAKVAVYKAARPPDSRSPKSKSTVIVPQPEGAATAFTTSPHPPPSPPSPL